MNYIEKRIKSWGWVGLAGVISTVLLLVIENISRFNLSETTQAITLIVLTATVSQITKYLNVDLKRAKK